MKIVRLTAIVLAVLLVPILALPFLIDPNDFRPRLESSLSQALGRDVKVGDLKLSIFSGGVTASDLSIAENPAFGKTPFVQAKSLRVGVELWPLITSHKLNVTGITVERPEIQLIQNAAGEWNFSSLGSKTTAKPKTPESAPSGKGLDLSIKTVKITEGRFSVGKLVLEAVNLELRDFPSSSASPFSFSCQVAGGGEIQLDGKAGPIAQEDVETTAVSAALKVTGLDLAAISNMAGVANFEGSAESNGKVAQIKGKLQADKLRFAKGGKPADRPVELAFAVDHNLKTRSGRLTQGDIRIGGAAVRLLGVYTQTAGATVLRMNLSGPDMPVPELAAMLPAMGIVLPAGSSLQGGNASVKFALEGSTSNLIVTGSVDFEKTTLAGFDLGRKMSVIQTVAGLKSGPNTEIQTLSINLRMSPEGIRAESIRMVVPAIGELGGAGTVSAANSLDFRMTALLHTSGLMAAIRDAPIPFLVGGTASDPIFRPDVRAIVSEKAKTAGTKAVRGLLDRYLGGKK